MGQVTARAPIWPSDNIPYLVKVDFLLIYIYNFIYHIMKVKICVMVKRCQKIVYMMNDIGCIWFMLTHPVWKESL